MEEICFSLKPLPKNLDEAIKWLLMLVGESDCKTLQQVSPDKFKRGWYAIGFLYPGLHPDSALLHGAEVSNNIADCPIISKIEPHLIAPFYTESGWPVVLALSWKKHGGVTMPVI